MIGGGNDLGEAIAKRFQETYFKKWQVLNIDFHNQPNGNSKAAKNILFKEGEMLDENRMQELRKEIFDFTEEASAIINLNRLTDLRSSLSFKEEEIFDEYFRIRDVELKSSMLTFHLAGHHVSPNGYVCLSSTIDSLSDVPSSEEKAKTLNYINRAMR